MDTALEIVSITIFLGVMPSIAARSVKIALAGEHLGFLLGGLSFLGAVTAAFQLPAKYNSIGIFTGFVGSLLAVYYYKRPLK